MDTEENLWEQLETHMHENLGVYGLKMMSEFIDLKEKAEDCGMCPPEINSAPVFLGFPGIRPLKTR